jgi:hypothetical protein
MAAYEVMSLTADVLIVGGGTAGCFAAAAAAAEGATVVLLEQDFALGGAGVRGAIHYYWYGSTGGSQHKIDRAVSNLYASFGAKAIGFNPDAKRTALNELLGHERVRIVFGAMVYETLHSGDQIQGVIAATEEGPLQVTAKVVIDATGDGDVAASAGVPYQIGREGDGVVHVYSMVPRVVLHDQKIDHINFDSGWVDPTNPWDVSCALREGRRQIYDLAMKGEWELGSKVKPFDHLIGISPQIGIRESRLMKGEYRISFEDLVMRRSFDDKIMRCFTHYDNHGIDLGNETMNSQIWKGIMRLAMVKLSCDIPYRSIVAAEVKGLLLAGRCMSLERDAAAGIRMQRDMQKIGEAAGVAAALASLGNKQPHEIDVRQLQTKLEALGVIKDEERMMEPSYPNVQFETSALADIRLNHSIANNHLDQILDYLGQEDPTEQGRALWWIMQIGESARMRLLELRSGGTMSLAHSTTILHAMGLIRMEEAIPALCESVMKQDANWRSAIILLRHIGTTAACCETADLLATHSCESKDEPLLVQYLSGIADRLSIEEKQYVKKQVRTWLASPLMEKMITIPRGRREVSLRWNLEISGMILLHQLGDIHAAERCREYAKSSRSHIRIAAEKALERMNDSFVQRECEQ